jgi:predicted permease
MIESLHGRGGLPLGLLVDQLGSYLALATVGIAVASCYGAERRPSVRATLHQVLTFPPFVALVIALLLRPLPMPPVLDALLVRLGDTVAPVALLSVGMQLRFDALRQQARLLCFGLGYKLLVCPAIVVALLWAAGGEPDMASCVSVIEAAMPPMIGAAVVATQHRLDAKLVALMVGLGVPLGLSTAPAWHWLHCVQSIG